jgi:hypothetical protein
METWNYNPRTLTLRLNQRPWYEIDLERCRTSAEVLDWIAQVAGKTWATDEILGALVRRLNELLYLQELLCPCGQDRKIDVKTLLGPDPSKKGIALSLGRGDS